ncbi:MAG: LAGLIDADG family homing endonuclease [Dokdonella sp.]
MSTVRLEQLARGAAEIPLQPASYDIWDKKYRLKSKQGEAVDTSIDHSYQRIAKALAGVEATPEKQNYWYDRFLWALRRGAIPAGRITSNAGAQEHKPKTSTINCTVSGTIEDSMDNILERVHEAGLTLKAGCVAPGTWVVTEQGLVTADAAVAGKHAEILSYDRAARRFEMRRIEQHLTTHVARADNIEIRANGVSLKTSVRHPVLVYRDGAQRYVRADEVAATDALVQNAFAWRADEATMMNAWFAGAHLGDGSAYEKQHSYRASRQAWQQRAALLGRRLVFRIRAAEREVVERYAAFFAGFCASRAQVVSATTPNGTPVWDYAVASFAASRAAELIDEQIGAKTVHLHVPAWIAQHPERHFLPFLAGLIDTDGTISREYGSATVATQNATFAGELKALLGLFGVHGALTLRKPREHDYNGSTIRDSGGAMLKISDSAFLAEVARYMADSGKRTRIAEHASQPGQYDHYVLPTDLANALAELASTLGHEERQHLGFYHGYHTRHVVSRVWLDRWVARFPALQPLIDFARCLRPVEAIERNLDLPETFYDFTVEGHNNYLAGNAGLLVIHNCGIGYEFSTLRPRGAYVSGAGAYTSGPLSFMDIYDKMCFTVSSAGGRRGAQMGTFDVSHPDAKEFVRAKREDGRLRQFNLSLLITDGFMDAVEVDADWPLVFPIHIKEQGEIDLTDAAIVVWREWPTHKNYVVRDDGLVACKIYGHIKARHLWDMIMVSTYDYAEPGFILIDRVNEMNNNWWCEHIRATNPCVTADTWVQTSEGPRQVQDLLGREFLARVDGQDHATGSEGFFRTATKPVFALQTEEGHRLRLTADHRVRRVSRMTRWSLETEWCAAEMLRAGDRVLLNNHRANSEWAGALTQEQGYLLGLLVGDGTLKQEAAVLSVWSQANAVNAVGVAAPTSLMTEALRCAQTLPHRSNFAGWSEVAGRNEWRMKSASLRDLAFDLGLAPGNKAITPAIEQSSSDAYRGFLRGFFDADGSVQGSQTKGVSVRLAQSDIARLEAVQRMLARLGILSTIYRDRRVAGTADLPDGHGGTRAYPTQAQHELVISGESLARYADQIGFADATKSARLTATLSGYRRSLNRDRFVATVATVEADGIEDVYDVQVPGINTFDGNGLHAHNCGEQPLPPYGSCLLGSVNLTTFVRDPFGPKARFDWEEYREVVRVFTRMLDNVVEINGLPLPQQRAEIESKRRHGMGFLGLGSTLTMLKHRYGTPDAVAFTEEVSREMALAGWEVALSLAKEKGPAPILTQDFAVTGEMLRKRPEMVDDGWKLGDTIRGRVLHAKYSRYMQRVATVAPELVQELAEVGARFTHHTSIAPTGTISLSLANNASNGIEPSFAHHYSRNVIREGKKSKEKVEVFSFELLAYRELINGKAMPLSQEPEEKLPDYFVSADDISPVEHVDIQAAAQKWVDSSISKTANVPTDYPYEDFKDIYRYAHKQGLKGCTTFRFNPAAFQGVLVKEHDLANTTYRFELEDGSMVEAKGNEEIEYDGETHTAANLFDALKEGYYGKF